MRQAPDNAAAIIQIHYDAVHITAYVIQYLLIYFKRNNSDVLRILDEHPIRLYSACWTIKRELQPLGR
jgi:hypothetical protein